MRIDLRCELSKIECRSAGEGFPVKQGKTSKFLVLDFYPVLKWVGCLSEALLIGKQEFKPIQGKMVFPYSKSVKQPTMCGHGLT